MWSAPTALFVAVGLVVVGFLLRTWFTSEKGRRTWEGLMLQSPVVGPLVAAVRHGAVLPDAGHAAGRGRAAGARA